MQLATTLKVLTPLASLGIFFASESFAVESWQPIILTAAQVCECSPATTTASRGAASAWQTGRVVVAELPRTTEISPAVAPRLQSAGNNLALRPLVVSDDPVPAMTPLPGPTVQVWRPVVAPSPAASPYQLGTGLIGQPKLYVPGQPIRNIIRYLSP